MRRASVLLICVAGAIHAACGQGTIILDSPRDDRKARADVAGQKELEAPRGVYDAFLTQLRTFSRSEIIRICGAPLSSRPDSAILPVFGPRAYSVPGMMIRPSNGFFSVGSEGFADIQFDGEHVVAAVLYFRADESFVPLRNTEDLAARLSWDVRQLEQVHHWWAERSRSAPHPNT
jgi:hypothetical protein